MRIFTFQFALEVLNHLGRGLYRNFATVIAEAVSNSWDAEATRVDIEVDKNAKTMTIKDNGKGMDEDEFQGRFLRVGYTRRDDPQNLSKRKVLGRKGIGKLAMLSISDKITIHSKKENSPETGGCIDNSDLDENIKSDKAYSLGTIGSNRVFEDDETGTYLKFESIKDSINRPEILRKYLAIMFNFSFSFAKEKFDIYLNGTKISEDDLEELYNSTEFLWQVGSNDSIRSRFQKLRKESDILDKGQFSHNGVDYTIEGYVASVDKVSKLKVRGSGDNAQKDSGEFKAGVHLFVNGRIRQENILDDLGSNRLTIRYLYGEIHVDGFDDGDDIFTSNREGIIRDDPIYEAFLVELKEIQQKVINDWDKWRRGKSKKPLEAVFDNLKKEKKAVIQDLLGKKDDEITVEDVTKGIRKLMPDAFSSKKILICHSRKDKNLADKVERKLREKGFNPSDILYASSDDEESKLPASGSIFDYMKEFFVQDWVPGPFVVFVISPNMEKSWFASLEAGATWVIGAKHKITTKENHAPKKPLNIDDLYLEFDGNGEFNDLNDAERVFRFIWENYGRQ